MSIFCFAMHASALNEFLQMNTKEPIKLSMNGKEKKQDGGSKMRSDSMMHKSQSKAQTILPTPVEYVCPCGTPWMDMVTGQITAKVSKEFGKDVGVMTCTACGNKIMGGALVNGKVSFP